MSLQSTISHITYKEHPYFMYCKIYFQHTQTHLQLSLESDDDLHFCLLAIHFLMAKYSYPGTTGPVAGGTYECGVYITGNHRFFFFFPKPRFLPSSCPFILQYLGASQAQLSSGVIAHMSPGLILHLLSTAFIWSLQCLFCPPAELGLDVTGHTTLCKATALWAS